MELATDENFSEAGYLEANPDIRAAGIPPRVHFECYGRQERRVQFPGPPSLRPSRRVTVLGNCQAPVMALCLRAMMPDAEVHGIHFGLDNPVPAMVSDVVLLQTELSRLKDDRGYIPESVAERVHLWPTFYYPAFHPDIVYARAGDAALRSPMHDYNSALVLYGWLNRLTITQTIAMFCEEVFDRLGYFDYRASADSYFIADCENAGLDGVATLASLSASAPFCHAVNHPHIAALARITERVLDAAGIAASGRGVEKFLGDPLLSAQVWPVYPHIADRFGLAGDYRFKTSGVPGRILDLETFVVASYESYDAHDPSSITADRLIRQADRYREIESHAQKSRTRAANPYLKLPDHRFWRKAVSGVVPSELDPVVKPKFCLSPRDRISTAGSCFAQHIARTLRAKGFNYFVTEYGQQAPDSSQGEGQASLFSARFGNVYSARQLLQLAQRAYGAFEPHDKAWIRPDGRHVDPFRPQIEPAGYGSEDQVVAELPKHYAAIRAMFERSDLFIFTVGLTEIWQSIVDGAVFPVAPGVIARPRDPSSYKFSNSTAAEVKGDLDAFVTWVRGINPGLKIILTVSPVPLVATYEDQNVLLATTYSKSVLRAAAEEISRQYDFVDYFPSYEIITSWYNRGKYFDDDLRSITADGVEHVMRVFSRHYLQGDRNGLGQDPALLSEFASSSKILCDEEALDATA